MHRREGKPNRHRLYSVYRRVKNSRGENGEEMCCEEWRRSPDRFYTWYADRVKEQSGLCEYCHLPGDTTDNYGPIGFRKGRRGFNLEVDRKYAKGIYSPDNCVLACYPCNNAKSDVFSYEEFVVIGEAIGKAKGGLK